MVISFAWSALVSYAQTPQGSAELADIEAVLMEIENPGTQTNPPTSGTSAPSSTSPQIVRK